MLRLDNDIKSMQSFANRAYSNEMSIQKTVLRDLLGGKFHPGTPNHSLSFSTCSQNLTLYLPLTQ